MNINLVPHLKSFGLKTDKSKKTNNDYDYLDIVFNNNYSMRFFPNREQKFILQSMTKSQQIPVTSPEDTKSDDGLDFIPQ